MRFTPWKVPPRSPIMRRLMSSAKTTLLPANHSLGTKKGLHSNEQLDDNQDPFRTFGQLNTDVTIDAFVNVFIKPQSTLWRHGQEPVGRSSAG